MRVGRCDEARILGSVGRRRKAGGNSGPTGGTGEWGEEGEAEGDPPSPPAPSWSGEGATGHSQTGMSLQQSVRPVCQSLSWVW